ncbi:MAG TPA: GNAT family N-acetyltransferase [Stellaceae bacterium]|nr:GNAT family N-acetyltransferase [Stellaceae bacterium]
MTTAAPEPDLKRLKIVPLPSDAALSAFRSGEAEIDRNLGKCCDWHRWHRSRVFCAYLGDGPSAYGFYCLGLHAHDAKTMEGFFTRAQDDVRNFVPFIYISYLAVQEGWRRRKIGTMLLLNALERCALVIRNIGAYGVALNALTDDSAAFYDRYGFRAKSDGKGKWPLMVLPAQSILDLFR